jgi:hypothetical protein
MVGTPVVLVEMVLVDMEGAQPRSPPANPQMSVHFISH